MESAAKVKTEDTAEAEAPVASKTTNATTTEGASSTADLRKIYRESELVEIIHLHDCLRGAVKALEEDVNSLSQCVLARRNNNDNNNNNNNNNGTGREQQQQPSAQSSQLLETLERQIAGRFKVIWSVFRAHSSAEDEFIWPALQAKTLGRIKHHHSHPQATSPKYRPGTNGQEHGVSLTPTSEARKGGDAMTSSAQQQSGEEDNHIEQSEYEEDHASEEIMFERIDSVLAQLRKVIVERKNLVSQHDPMRDDTTSSTAAVDSSSNHLQLISLSDIIDETAQSLFQHTKSLSKHLYTHLEKEENQCMPLVVKHLSRSEIHDLVGNIMGKRSSDLIAQIMTMAVQNLTHDEREEMIKYMKQAMEGTFFDRWLLMSGWGASSNSLTTADASSSKSGVQMDPVADSVPGAASLGGNEASMSAVAEATRKREPGDILSLGQGPEKRKNLGDAISSEHILAAGANITGQAELERLIRAVVSNPSLTALQKNTTVQGLRDSVWKSNQRHRQTSEQQAHAFAPQATTVLTSNVGLTAALGIRMRRTTPPSSYLKKNGEGKVEVVWSSDSPSSVCPNDGSVPLFSAAELAPTYHDGAAGAVLGCPHYSRACKLRHPKSGRLYTCRLCCEQERDMPMKDKDEPLDRNAVTEVMCMKCNALQPAEDRCMNSLCESYGKPFAKYFCRICHLYDDRSRPIFHCPYCNTCRMGLGLGIDFRHCMRCNACVSLADNDHRCIPQKLQGSCPICHESMFSSTEPLRGLKCGHVMHLSCFNEYRRGHAYVCPLCQKSMEDMKDHFAMLDTAIRMQPMPTSYLSTLSNIYCQDCCKTGQCQYHFVGQKCPHCGSYNTREMGRVQNPPTHTQALP